MESQSKKCPMCAEEVPLTAATCEYCSAQFIVTSTGYCQNCHQVREADGNGQCKVCGNTVMDLRVESKLIEEPVQKPSPAAQPKTRKTGKSRLLSGTLAGILIFTFVSTFLWFGRNGTPAVSTLFTTSTPTVAATFTPTRRPPTAISTHAARPTPTATPVPTWVAEFSQPILSAIANTLPHFEDDFSHESDDWHKKDDRCKVKIQDGAFTMSVETGREMAHCSNPGMRMKNFVLRVDTDFSQMGSSDSADIGWRGKDHSGGLTLSIWKNSRWSIYFCGDSCPELAAGWKPISLNQKVAVTIISKGGQYAIYMDEIPVSYVNDSYVPDNGRDLGIVLKLGVSVPSKSPSPMIKYDNLKIWNLDYVPNLP